jgi:AhpD family alkylhydroperoxidase
VIYLVVSQVNECKYCLAAHTVVGKMNGFTDAQGLEICSGKAEFDVNLNALGRFVSEVVVCRGKPSEESVAALLDSVYTSESNIDIVVVIGDKIITNYLHCITQVPIDFPAAPKLDSCGCGHDAYATR